MEMCEWLSRENGKPATEIFKRYLGLMDKYDGYFFSEPWPKEYNYEKATTFTEEDREFLFENEEEFGDRFDTVCLKKNMYLDGFMGYFGMYWTEQAFHKEFIRPELKPISEAFLKYTENSDNAREVLNKLKEQFQDVKLIHASLIDVLETDYLDQPRDLRVAEILELIHTEEGFLACDNYRCKLQREKLQKSTN
jgi:hypothetical protein